MPVAILDLGGDGPHRVLVAGLGQTPIELQTLAGVGDELVGQKGRHVDRDLGIMLGANRLSAQLGHRLLQDARVGVEPNRRDAGRTACAPRSSPAPRISKSAVAI